MEHDKIITEEAAGRQICTVRTFKAPADIVWEAWTQAAILDKWWGPGPWRAETKSMNFKDGGRWHYSMVGPNSERHWVVVDFDTVHPQRSFTAVSTFSDEDEGLDDSFPAMHWLVEFTGDGAATTVNITITVDSDAALQQVVERGFNQGFAMGLENLRKLLED